MLRVGILKYVVQLYGSAYIPYGVRARAPKYARRSPWKSPFGLIWARSRSVSIVYTQYSLTVLSVRPSCRSLAGGTWQLARHANSDYHASTLMTNRRATERRIVRCCMVMITDLLLYVVYSKVVCTNNCTCSTCQYTYLWLSQMI